MPLELGYLGNLDEQPLTRGVLEARLENTQLHGAAGVHEDFLELCLPPGAVLSVDALAEIEETGCK